MKLLVVLLFMIEGRALFQLDNEIVGEPKLECNTDDIVFSFNTRKPFRGNVYVRGYYGSNGCSRPFDSQHQSGGHLSIRIGDCGMRRSRQIGGPRGVNQHITVVANFHRLFTTKEDRTFNVRCFYAHSESVVKTDLSVSPMAEESLEQAATIIPQCTYTLREGSLEGPKVTSTRVGMKIFHRWECDTSGNYGILLRGCTILGSRGGESVPFLDDNGCSVLYDFPQVVYSESLTTAYMAVEAISFPDQPSISFACQIRLCDKRSDECREMHPPPCPLAQIPHIPFDNRIENTFDGIPVEPWMKEPSPPIDDSNQTTVISGEPMPRLISEEEQNQIASNHIEGREKRFAHRLFNISSENIFVDLNEPTKLETPGAPEEYSGASIAKPCISIETFYISAFAVLFVFVVSIGMVCFAGSHVLKK
ncbi:CRE-CUTL-13 protein [Caenorhabditis remanei]|uniref:CRE-CUTL-13 protein n=1 Tax=Caenorhabditis remanei TaxID=31234 RepID=E3LX95_CAERE|nr:CRE-CUTL-13 protein [Caenorhabditis remanei]